MTRKQAEAERERMAKEHPEATWMIAEQSPGEWSLVKVGLMPADSESVESTEERPIPSYADDPRNAHERNVGGPLGPVGG